MTNRSLPFTRLLTTAAFGFASLGLMACDSGPDPVQVAADQVWKERCVTCHGETGKGDGPGAAALDPKPRSFASAQWQSSVTDERIKQVIVDGGAAVGLSAAMAPNPDLKEKPAVQDALVKKIRKLTQ